MLIFTCDMIKDVIKSTCTSYHYWHYLFSEKRSLFSPDSY